MLVLHFDNINRNRVIRYISLSTYACLDDIQVIKTYNACEAILEKEFGIDPLPETRKVLDESRAM